MDFDPDSDGAAAAHDSLLDHPHAKIVMLTGERNDDVLSCWRCSSRGSAG
jgi:hypothetical protein